MLYTSSSLALALLEVLVHVKIDQIPDDYVWMFAEFSDDLVQHISQTPTDTEEYGTQWLRGTDKPILGVHSIIVPEKNFLLNPDHTQFIQIKWSKWYPLQIDPRLTHAEMTHATSEPIKTTTLTPSSGLS